MSGVGHGASYASHGKYHYLHHNSGVSEQVPPVLNQWYTIIDDNDVRMLNCTIYQQNGEAAVKNIQVEWIIDDVTYNITIAAANATNYAVIRDIYRSIAGVGGLYSIAGVRNAGGYTDIRGQALKVRFRITSALGSNQVISGFVVYETLEVT